MKKEKRMYVGTILLIVLIFATLIALLVISNNPLFSPLTLRSNTQNPFSSVATTTQKDTGKVDLTTNPKTDENIPTQTASQKQLADCIGKAVETLKSQSNSEKLMVATPDEKNQEAKPDCNYLRTVVEMDKCMLDGNALAKENKELYNGLQKKLDSDSSELAKYC